VPFRRRNNPGRSWQVHVSVQGVRHFKTLPGDLSRKQVAAWERQWRAELERAPATSTHTVAAVLDRYWRERGIARARNVSLRSNLGLWGEALGLDTPAVQVHASHVSAVMARWRGSVSPATKRPLSDPTVNRRLDALQVAWAYAADVLGIPVQRIPWRTLRLAEPEPPDRSIGPAAVARLLAAWPERTRPLAELLFATGMRFGAAFRLERRDVDLERRVLHSRTKGRGGGKPIVVALTTQAVAVLERLAMPEVGRIWGFTFAQARWDREQARKAAGLPKWRWHDCRHELGQMLEDAGLGAHVADALHHSNQSYRRRYAHARPDVIRDAVEEAQARRK
jgi:integrase